MKLTRFLLPALLIGMLLGGCGAGIPQGATATPLGKSMKGYELYSWQEGNQWKFSLLVGTNREKTLEEIKSSQLIFTGVDAVISTLKTVPGGQTITWSSKESLSLPPDEILEQVVQVCKDQGLVLAVAR